MERRTERPAEMLLPQNVEAEQGVLGSIIIDPEALDKVVRFLRPDDFYRDAHRLIYESIVRMSGQHTPADFLTICDDLERTNQLENVGGASYLTSLINLVPTSGNVEYYGHIVERASILRRLIMVAGQIAALAYEYQEADVSGALTQAERLVFETSQRYLLGSASDISMPELMSLYASLLEQRYRNRGRVTGVPTGYADLDRLLAGLQRSDLLLLAARTSVGKTAWALNVAYNAARAGHRVGIFSLEMGKEQLAQRFVAMESRVEQQRLRSGWIEEDEWETLVAAMDRMAELGMYIDDLPGISLLQMRSRARQWVLEHGVELLIVDYLQLITPGETRRYETREQEVSSISRGLKGLARELNVPVLALSQLSRALETRQVKVPQLSDLRESGCLAGDTMVYLPEEGKERRIDALIGQRGFKVLALNEQTCKLEPKSIVRAFSTGWKPVYKLTTRSGQSIRATSNHQFLASQGWKKLEDLASSMPIALPRQLQGPFRAMMRVAPGVQLEQRSPLSHGDISWDEVVSIEPDGEAEVYDLTVEEHHNFVANNILVHNSLEQDADVVMFIYRDEVYNAETTRPHQADIIVAKQRNGPTGEVALYFNQAQGRFHNLDAGTLSDGSEVAFAVEDDDAVPGEES